MPDAGILSSVQEFSALNYLAKQSASKIINPERCIMSIKTGPEKLLKKHRDLIHSDLLKVTSHVQRKSGEWILNTVMVEGYDVPFKYKRKREYKNLSGQRVNMTYYADSISVAGMNIEIMNVVRIKIA